jgi:DNA-binding MarR family transcriptional regulator
MSADREELIEALVREMPWYISASMRYQIAIAHQLGMPVTDVHAVGALVELGPIGARQLADLMGMTTGAVTRLVDRLERGGFVRREPDPNDRRRIVLRVVPDRVGEIARYYEPMGRRWQERVADYSNKELRFLLTFLQRGREDTDAETAALRADGRTHGTRKPRKH